MIAIKARKKINWGSDEDFIQRYVELKSSRKMGELYGCTKKTIINHCKDIGFDYTSLKRGKLSDADKQKIIAEYETKTSGQLADEYGVTRGIITKIWYDNNLKNKTRDITNCGNDLIGMTFGHLTVVACSKKRAANGGKYWICSCSCGRSDCLQIKEVYGDSLLSGTTSSCGTISREMLDIGRGHNFKDMTGMVFGKLKVIKQDVSRTDYVVWECVCECGNRTYVMSQNLSSGNTQSCGLCRNNSHGNTKIEQILKDNNIPYEREKRFNDCRDKLPLPFDFYVNGQYCIEYDGKQHYSDCNTLFYNKVIARHDSIKSNWCKKNNIPLIRIPYTQYNSLCIEDIMIETSSFIEK